MDDAQQGFEVRRLAAQCLGEVLDRRRMLDEVVERDSAAAALAPRDRAFLQAIVMVSLRRKGEIDAVLGRFLEKPLPRKSGSARWILETAVAQLLFMAVPPHAVVDLAARLAKADPQARHFVGVINGVLRNVARGGADLAAAAGGVRAGIPDWCWQRWHSAFGAQAATAIAEARLREPALDITPKADAALWAGRLGGRLLSTGSIRLAGGHAPVDRLPGFGEGAWWVQDAAAALPAKLLGEVAGLSVLDLCAAPGGKTLQLAAAGARVTAVDKSAGRLQRLGQNLARTGLVATCVTGDAATAAGDAMFDAVLLDAPCSATGTVRRHPELLLLKTPEQIHDMARLQARLLDAAARRLKPGGLLIYCTCSLEPEECEGQVQAFLGRSEGFELVPVREGEAGIPAAFIASPGVLRTRPDQSIDGLPGVDGFFAARFRRL